MELGLEKETLFDYTRETDLWEYLLVAKPDTNVCKRIIEVRQSFCEVYKEDLIFDTVPFLTIASFHARIRMEETLIRWIQRICSQHKSFTVTLNNYGGFPPHTIFVRVQNFEPFRQLASKLKVIDQYVQSNGCPEAIHVTRPHVTIADRLGPPLFNKAMLDYSQKTFHETFQLTELVLSKRSNPFDRCKEVNVFRFYPPDTNMCIQVA